MVQRLALIALVFPIMPNGYSSELETGTDNGGLHVEFPAAVRSALNRRHFSTTLGTGGPKIRAMTMNGGVTIRERQPAQPAARPIEAIVHVDQSS